MNSSPKADKNTIVAVFQELATLLDLSGANPFRVRAFENGARVLEGYAGDLVEDLESGELAKTRGIGKGLLGEIESLLTTGESPLRQELLEEIPPGLLEMLRVPGLGAKKVKKLYDELGIESIDALETAAKAEEIAPLKGFGKKSQDKILDNIAIARRRLGRQPLAQAWPRAQRLLEAVAAEKSVVRCSVAGSIRRRRETIGDIDILVASDDATAVFDRVVSLDDVDEVILRGDTKTSLRLVGDSIQVDVRVVSDRQYPFALHYFTGSKEHNTVLRGRARERGLKLNEYGLFPEDSDVSLECADEDAIFAALDLPPIAAELRENLGEIEAAEKGQLPVLVTDKQMLGSWVMIDPDEDGSAKAIVAAAKKAGWKYVGLVEPWNGEGPVGAGVEAMRKAFARTKGITVSIGVEVDIAPDGSIDLDADAQPDFTVARVHGAFGLPRAKQTERLQQAAADPRVTILDGRPDGASRLDIETRLVLDALGKHGGALRFGERAGRHGFGWRVARAAMEAGAQLAVCPDVVGVAGVEAQQYALALSRKAWATKQGLLNCAKPPAWPRKSKGKK